MSKIQIFFWELYVTEQIGYVCHHINQSLDAHKLIFKQLDCAEFKKDVFSHIGNVFIEGKSFYFETLAKAREEDLYHSASLHVALRKTKESILTEQTKLIICHELRFDLADVAFLWAVSGRSASWIEQRIRPSLETILSSILYFSCSTTPNNVRTEIVRTSHSSSSLLIYTPDKEEGLARDMIRILVSGGYNRGTLLKHREGVLLHNSCSSVTDSHAVRFVSSFFTEGTLFYYSAKATELSKNVQKAMQIRILLLRELHGPTLTDEMLHDILKEFEHEIVTLACLWAMLGWTEKKIHDAIVSFLNPDKNDF